MAISRAGCCEVLLGFVSDHLHITTQALISHFSYRDTGVARPTTSAASFRVSVMTPLHHKPDWHKKLFITATEIALEQPQLSE